MDEHVNTIMPIVTYVREWIFCLLLTIVWTQKNDDVRKFWHSARLEFPLWAFLYEMETKHGQQYPTHIYLFVTANGLKRQTDGQRRNSVESQ